jgi:hypothetical protein
MIIALLTIVLLLIAMKIMVVNLSDTKFDKYLWGLMFSLTIISVFCQGVLGLT